MTTAGSIDIGVSRTSQPHCYDQYARRVAEEMHDDACDLGQFFLNPASFLFVKTSHVIRRFLKDQSDIVHVQSKDTKRSNMLHLQLPAYLLFILGGWISVFTKVYPIIRQSNELSNVHIQVGYAVFAACIVSWRYASLISPGIITPDNMWKYDNYHYDDILHVEEEKFSDVPGNDGECSMATTTIHPQRKLARSKYDRYSQTTVSRFDHYCGWLRQPIGEENYRVFLSFVSIHAFMCAYGTYVIATLVMEGPVNGRARGRRQGILGILLNDKTLTTIGLFLCSAAVPLIGFFGFHLYLVCRGMTTNEYHKWELIRSRHEAAQKKYESRNHIANQRSNEEGSQFEDILDPGPMPSNSYDLGVVGNVCEVLFPRSIKKEASKHD